MTYGESCEWCVYRDKKNPDICKNYSLNEAARAKFELGKVDIWELAKSLNKDKKKDSIVKETERYKLLICLDCHEPSLFYDKTQ